MKESNKISRRKFLKVFGSGSVVATAALTGCKNATKEASDEYTKQVEPPTGKMTYRVNPKTKDKVSILGYGMMRLPLVGGDQSQESTAPIDQKAVNKLVDYAIAHGVNYFDTSPAYCQGNSESANSQ